MSVKSMGMSVGHQQMAKFLLSMLFSFELSDTLCGAYKKVSINESQTVDSPNVSPPNLLHKVLEYIFEYGKVDGRQLLEQRF